MLWELMRQGYLPHWWEYVTFVACMLILVAGPTAIRMLRPIRRRDRGEEVRPPVVSAHWPGMRLQDPALDRDTDDYR